MNITTKGVTYHVDNESQLMTFIDWYYRDFFLDYFRLYPQKKVS